MTEAAFEKDKHIVIEFTSREGEEQVSLFSRPREMVEEKSEKALASAMSTIEEMAQRIASLQDRIPVEFSQAEVGFGIAFDWETGGFIAKAGTEASINVTLTWTRTSSK